MLNVMCRVCVRRESWLWEAMVVHGSLCYTSAKCSLQIHKCSVSELGTFDWQRICQRDQGKPSILSVSAEEAQRATFTVKDAYNGITNSIILILASFFLMFEFNQLVRWRRQDNAVHAIIIVMIISSFPPLFTKCIPWHMFIHSIVNSLGHIIKPYFRSHKTKTCISVTSTPVQCTNT